MSFSDLPVELHYNILKYLHYEDLLLSASMIDVRMNSIVNTYDRFVSREKISNFTYFQDSIYLRWRTDEKLSSLFESLHFNITIREFYLYIPLSVSSEVLKKLSKTLKINNSIRFFRVYLSKTSQILDILPGFINSPSIETLEVSFSEYNLHHLDVSTLSNSVCEIVKSNKVLKHLDISHINIGNDLMHQIIESFQTNLSIKSLKAMGVSCTIDESLLDAIANTNLENVSMEYNIIKNLQYVSKWIKNNKCIIKI